MLVGNTRYGLLLIILCVQSFQQKEQFRNLVFCAVILADDDGDGIPNYLDDDDDNDGIPDDEDGDDDNDGVPDSQEDDEDGDGL